MKRKRNRPKPPEFRNCKHCGVRFEVKGWRLIRGMDKFCGTSCRFAHPKKHGHAMRGALTPTYRTWLGMRQRCTNPAFSNYRIYGGRGIKICERWSDFSNFVADMGERPAGKSLDRIDSNGNYEPGNCRWATRAEQSLNKRDTIMYNGRPAISICRERGLSQSAFRLRLAAGWPMERALFEPMRLDKRHQK